ncbi:UDP-N-acetylglucosamine 4,6-dehydratase [Amylibacter sp.]|nr:UDP-N-acetylglucosamine 4,6-dehydratase [Amylibacter sp.]
MDLNFILGNRASLFEKDIDFLSEEIKAIVTSSRFLVIGGAGSIGQALVKEIFKRDPKVLHVVDISENNLVEMVRDLRSSIGYISGRFDTFSLDVGSNEFLRLLTDQEPYDYVMNLSALKHVRSEKDPYTLMRMVDVNIINTLEILKHLRNSGVSNYFSVSTDKAANPVNLMGASKRIMEMFLMQESQIHNISMARFANVAFSDGSLLHGFQQRLFKRQPFSAPSDIRRYFITPKEAGELCLIATLFGNNRDILFPKLNSDFKPIALSDIAVRYLDTNGLKALECATEQEARDRALSMRDGEPWPCYFFKSDTTGEKEIEEFYTANETVNNNLFQGIGVIESPVIEYGEKLELFLDEILQLRSSKNWNKLDVVSAFEKLIPNFYHKELSKNLNQRM